MFDRFLIAPLNTGLQTNLKPWLIAEDAFQQLQNAYVFRGRVRKRFGSLYTGAGWPNAFVQPNYSRLGINVGTTDGSGNLSVNVVSLLSADLELGSAAVGQQFLIGTQIFTVPTTGTPVVLLATTGSGTGTFNTTTGALVITGATINTIVWYYTGMPVMGLTQYDNQVLDNIPSIAFDTQFAYLYSAGQWIRIGPSAGRQWHGDDTNLFWATNWKGKTNNKTVMFVTNYQVTNPNGSQVATDDPIWFYDGNVWGDYTNYVPVVPAGTFNFTIIRADKSYLFTSRILVSFKERLIALNTIEYNATTGLNEQFVNRCRFTISGSPLATKTVTSGSDIANASFAWLEPRQNLSVTVGTATATASGAGAGFVDATTDEAIISAEFIKDRLIVYFEKSTWELVYTGNQLLPFYWQKINTELGCDSTFSIVPFDKEVLAIGNVGVHSCNGANVQRIDEKIPDEIFKLNEQPTAAVRVTGIRDYYVEMVYWAYPNDTAKRYPNQVLVYNYRNGSWAKNDDVITAMGYFDSQTSTTWLSSTPIIWAQANFTWNSGATATNFRQVIAGNQEGYVFIVAADTTTNAAVLSVTNMSQVGVTIELEIIAHTLINGDYISFPIDSNGNIISLQGVTITDINGNHPSIFLVTFVDPNTIAIGYNGYPLTLTLVNPMIPYQGGAVIARVSNIQILSKQWNPYISQDRNFYLAHIDFCVTTTARTIDGSGGRITVDYYPSGSKLSMLEAANGGTVGTQMGIGNGVLETFPYDPAIYPFESQQERLWHPIYFQTDGQTIQIFLYFSDDQITDPLVITAGFVLEGLCLYTQPTSARLQ